MVLPTLTEAERRLGQMLRRDSAQTGGQAHGERLMLMLTRSCELRCAYCFVGLTETYFGQEPSLDDSGRPTGDMPEITIQATVDILMRSPKPKIAIQLFGGEPTRRWDRVEFAMNYAGKHPNRAGRPLELQLTTNGLNFDAARLESVRKWGGTVQLSVDGTGGANRFRRPHLLSPDEATARWEKVVPALNDSGVVWFLNVTLPPAAAGETLDRYDQARDFGAQGLQLNYATGMPWSERQRVDYLGGLFRALVTDRGHPGQMRFFNHQNAADPAPLCGDAICDVDGTLLQVGGIFHERRFPSLYAAYRRGHFSEFETIGLARSSLSELWNRTAHALDADELGIFRQGMLLGAAQDLVCRMAQTA